MVFKPLLVCFIVFISLAGHLQAQETSLDKEKAYEQHYSEISYTQLRKAMDAGQVFLIDANSTESYTKGHIPLARSLYKPELLEAQLPVLKNYPIVVYCGGPQCTAWQRAADFAAARGYTSVMHFKGGIKGWKAQGDTLASGQE